jgi:SagB-type dehydrogenase family enzyme
MKTILVVCGLLLTASLLIAGCTEEPESTGTPAAPLVEGQETIPLPEPRYAGEVSVEESLRARRSERSFAADALTAGELGQILWAAQGITDPRGYRTAPSAGALYPLEVSVVIRDVENLSPGVYRYLPGEHALIPLASGDRTADLAEAAHGQEAVAGAPAALVISAVPSRTTVKYGERGMRYVYMEAGHAAQNVYLQATAWNLSTVSIGAFDDEAVAAVVPMDEDEAPLYIMPVGRRDA